VTSSSVDDPASLRRVLGRAEALFLDFDGPVCDVFAGLPAPVMVDQLCVVLADDGYGDPPPEVEKSLDPFDVLKYAITLGENEGQYVNAAFTALEAEAIVSAVPTPGGHELISAWSQRGKPMAVVSNNSAMAIRAYLDMHRLRSHEMYVSGRANSNLHLLKPNPFLLNQALEFLRLKAGHVAFVGDSPTDMQAATSAGCMSIGYANRATKVAALLGAGAGVTVREISTIADMVAVLS
jgi:phosphoglycolate phosphatase